MSDEHSRRILEAVPDLPAGALERSLQVADERGIEFARRQALSLAIARRLPATVPERPMIEALVHCGLSDQELLDWHAKLLDKRASR